MNFKEQLGLAAREYLFETYGDWEPNGSRFSAEERARIVMAFKASFKASAAWTLRESEVVVKAINALKVCIAHDYGKADLFDTAKNTINEAISEYEKAVNEL